MARERAVTKQLATIEGKRPCSPAAGSHLPMKSLVPSRAIAGMLWTRVYARKKTKRSRGMSADSVKKGLRTCSSSSLRFNKTLSLKRGEPLAHLFLVKRHIPNIIDVLLAFAAQTPLEEFSDIARHLASIGV